jgi:hypothetical protein
MKAYEFNAVINGKIIEVPVDFSDKITSARVIILYEEDYPLDDFDYKLARQADARENFETVSFDAALEECGLTHNDL